MDNYEYKYHKYKAKYLNLKGGYKKELYTIGHSNHTLQEFIKILQNNNISCLVDIRSYPGSKHVPQFNKKHLAKILPKHGITYTHIPELGGRRHNKSDLNTSIESPSFASYAAYMETDEFKEGIKQLKRIVKNCRTAGSKDPDKTVIMCAEVLWWRCHRRMISDWLTLVDHWQVYHLGIKKEPELHTVWNIARLDKKNKMIIYDKPVR
jgi:uncharacterized protein (DUF488 family)